MIYEAKCRVCNSVEEYVRPASEYLDTPKCCGQKMEKVILSVPFGVVDIPAYESPASGKWITSRAERREDFKRTGTRPWEGIKDERAEAAKQAKYAEQKADAVLDKTVRAAWAQLSPSKKAAALAAN